MIHEQKANNDIRQEPTSFAVIYIFHET